MYLSKKNDQILYKILMKYCHSALLLTLTIHWEEFVVLKCLKETERKSYFRNPLLNFFSQAFETNAWFCWNGVKIKRHENRARLKSQGWIMEDLPRLNTNLITKEILYVNICGHLSLVAKFFNRFKFFIRKNVIQSLYI